jgi:hypothetical protein
LSDIPEPYRVRCVVLRAELEFLDEKGRATGMGHSADIVCFEASFFPGLIEFLKEQGFKFDVPDKTSKKDAEKNAT